MKRIAVLAAILAISGTALAQSSTNDVGSSPSFTSTTGLAPITGLVQPGFTCPPAGVVQASITNANTQLGRIFRDGTASTCVPKGYPGNFNAGSTYNYTTAHYANTSAATACVTVNFDPNTGTTPCGTNAHMSAYLNSYDPANQGTNYVGDVGSSNTLPFSFQVPANTSLILATTNTSSQASCDFAYQVVSLPCTPPAAIPTLGEWGMILLTGLLAMAGFLGVRSQIRKSVSL